MCFKIWISNKNKVEKNKNYAEHCRCRAKLSKKKLFILPSTLANRVCIIYRVYRLYRANRFDGTNRVVFKGATPLNSFLNMERLPEEITLRILSYLPLSDVFHSVSLVSNFRQVSVLSTVLESPTTRQTLALKGLVSSVETKKEADVNSAIVADARNLIQTIKDGRSKDSRAAMQCCVSLLCGNNVAKNKM